MLLFTEMDLVTGNNSIRSLFLLSILIIWKLYPFATFTDKTAEAATSKFGVGVL